MNALGKEVEQTLPAGSPVMSPSASSATGSKAAGAIAKHDEAFDMKEFLVDFSRPSWNDSPGNVLSPEDQEKVSEILKTGRPIHALRLIEALMNPMPISSIKYGKDLRRWRSFPLINDLKNVQSARRFAGSFDSLVDPCTSQRMSGRALFGPGKTLGPKSTRATTEHDEDYLYEKALINLNKGNFDGHFAALSGKEQEKIIKFLGRGSEPVAALQPIFLHVKHLKEEAFVKLLSLNISGKYQAMWYLSCLALCVPRMTEAQQMRFATEVLEPRQEQLLYTLVREANHLEEMRGFVGKCLTRAKEAPGCKSFLQGLRWDVQKRKDFDPKWQGQLLTLLAPHSSPLVNADLPPTAVPAGIREIRLQI